MFAGEPPSLEAVQGLMTPNARFSTGAGPAIALAPTATLIIPRTPPNTPVLVPFIPGTPPLTLPFLADRVNALQGQVNAFEQRLRAVEQPQWQVNALEQRLREVEHSLRQVTGESPPWNSGWN